jgi:hypothetical protein
MQQAQRPSRTFKLEHNRHENHAFARDRIYRGAGKLFADLDALRTTSRAVCALDPLECGPVNTFKSSRSAFLRARGCTRLCALVFLATALFAIVPITLADSKLEIYHARLSPLGVTNATVDTTTGAGKATATLSANRLTIEATFEGLAGAATAANIRRGPKGIPGRVVFELQAPNASSGTLNATFELTLDQLKDLREARMYLQIHSGRAPDGSIRGWLLTPKR